MKKLFTLLVLIATMATFAQAPQGFNYQATVRNSAGALIVNQNVYFKFNLMQNSTTSVPVYSETHYVPTDDLGQINLVVGQGTANTGTFAAINWGTGNYYLGIELNTGSGYVAMGATQLMSVPYALQAANGITTTQADAIVAMQAQIVAMQAQITSLLPILTKTIGTQTWTTKNLDLATYSDGTLIPQVQNAQEWVSLTTGAWCYYNNDSVNGATYGKLYNWYAVAGIHDTDPNTPNKILAPTGWHVPSDDEWTTLTTYLGGEAFAGGAMKETGNTHWLSPNTDATNNSGFTGLPGGCRDYGMFGSIGSYGFWWSLSGNDMADIWGRHIGYGSGGATSNFYGGKTYGFSVRCIKD